MSAGGLIKSLASVRVVISPEKSLADPIIIPLKPALFELNISKSSLDEHFLIPDKLYGNGDTKTTKPGENLKWKE